MLMKLFWIVMGMELRHLRYFVAIARDENISQASRRLHVSQPPLSRQFAVAADSGD